MKDKHLPDLALVIIKLRLQLGSLLRGINQPKVEILSTGRAPWLEGGEGLPLWVDNYTLLSEFCLWLNIKQKSILIACCVKLLVSMFFLIFHTNHIFETIFCSLCSYRAWQCSFQIYCNFSLNFSFIVLIKMSSLYSHSLV